MDSAPVTLQEVLSVPDVPWTETWHPVHHRTVINSVDETLAGIGISVKSRRFTVRNGGLDAFGTYTLDAMSTGSRPRNMMIGFRNSMDKKFALGFVAGDYVFVCSNMAFCGSFVEHRKHTAGLDEESVAAFAAQAIGVCIDRGRSLGEWEDRLGSVPLVGNDLKAAFFDTLAEGIVAPSKFSRLLESYREELADNRSAQAQSVAHWHGAVTRTLRGMGLNQIMPRTQKLYDMADAYLPAKVVAG